MHVADEQDLDINEHDEKKEQDNDQDMYVLAKPVANVKVYGDTKVPLLVIRKVLMSASTGR